ncbi:MAG: hypothetical protein JW726_07810 [Anaerolineales bacterium]|nr:hypothetical protein [Anaerolineales bacterium]
MQKSAPASTVTKDVLNSGGQNKEALSIKRIIHTWWPLAASWMLMGAETPALSAIVARLPDPKIHLAAYGGIVFPLALIIESPIIMLLAASTALSKDWASYRRVWRYMMIASATITAIHILIAFTPLYTLVARDLLGAPPEIIEPARLGLMVMTPWTWSIAYRRFHQGVLIRFGHSKKVSVGTLIRLSTDLLVLAIGYTTGKAPGILVATSAVVAGVIAEAIYVGLVVRPVLHRQVIAAPPVEPALTLHSFLAFYIPLAMTSLLTLLVQPIGSAALGRMPLALESLAVWPVVTGITFLMRSLGIAYNEVVVALLDEPHSAANLWRFAQRLGSGATFFQFLVAVTPLASLWFISVSGLQPDLAQMARVGVWITLPMPLLATLQSWYQGVILQSRHTRVITEAVVVYMVTNVSTLIAGVAWGKTTGLYIGLASFVFSTAVQTIWLWLRSRTTVKQIRHRDTAYVPIQEQGI